MKVEISLEDEKVTIDETAGFFTSLTLLLVTLLKYYNLSGGKIPKTIDTSLILDWYKPRVYTWENKDLFTEFFVSASLSPASFPPFPVEGEATEEEDQYSDFKKLRYEDLLPFVKTFFSPSDLVLKRVDELEQKYGLVSQEDYEKTAGVFYRGLSKHKQMKLGSYEEFLAETEKFVGGGEDDSSSSTSSSSTIHNIIVQSDEFEFSEYFSKWGRQRLFFKSNERGESYKTRNLIFFEEIHKLSNEKRNCPQHGNVEFALDKDSRFDHAVTFLAIVLILSKCKKLIISSGNISYWICLFRGNAEGVRQYHVNKFV